MTPTLIFTIIIQCSVTTNPEVVHHTFQENSIVPFKVQREGTTKKKYKES